MAGMVTPMMTYWSTTRRRTPSPLRATWSRLGPVTPSVWSRLMTSSSGASEGRNDGWRLHPCYFKIYFIWSKIRKKNTYSTFCFALLQQHPMQHFIKLTIKPMRTQRAHTSTRMTSRWWCWYHGMSEKIGFRMSPPSIPFLQTYSIHQVALSTGFISLSVNSLDKVKDVHLKFTTMKKETPIFTCALFQVSVSFLCFQSTAW